MRDKEIAIKCYEIDLDILQEKRSTLKSIIDNLSRNLNKEKNHQLRKYLAEKIYSLSIELNEILDQIQRITKMLEMLKYE